MPLFARLIWKQTNAGHSKLLKSMFGKYHLSKWGVMHYDRLNSDTAKVRLCLHFNGGRKLVVKRRINARIYRDTMPGHSHDNFFFGIDPEQLLTELNK